MSQILEKKVTFPVEESNMTSYITSQAQSLTEDEEDPGKQVIVKRVDDLKAENNSIVEKDTTQNEGNVDDSGMSENALLMNKKQTVAEIQAQLKIALQKKAAYDKEKAKLDKKMVEMKANEVAEATAEVQMTTVLPPKEVEDHLWNDDEIQALKAIDLAERMKYKAKGKPRSLTPFEKKRILQREAKDTKTILNPDTFYEEDPQWFAFETRLRDMMLGILEPVVRKTLQDQNYVQRVIQNQSFQKSRLDEHENVVQRVMKRQNKADDFESRAMNLEEIFRRHDDQFEAKYQDIKQVLNQVNMLYGQMKHDKQDTMRALDTFEKEIKTYREQLEMNIIRLEALIETGQHNHKTLIDKLQDQMQTTLQRFDGLQTSQDNICDNYIKFGHNIEKNSYQIDILEKLTKELKEDKAEKAETIFRLSNLDKFQKEDRNELQELMKQQLKTDSYILRFQPISMITEVDKIFRAVLPRQRHQKKLQTYVQDRQNQLNKRAYELRNTRLDKDPSIFSLLAEPHIYNRKQSIDSDYIRTNIAMLKQHMKKSDSKGGHNHNHKKAFQNTKSVKFRGNKTHSAGMKNNWSNLKDKIVGDNKSSDNSSMLGDNFLKKKRAKTKPRDRERKSMLDTQGLKSQSLAMKLENDQQRLSRSHTNQGILSPQPDENVDQMAQSRSQDSISSDGSPQPLLKDKKMNKQQEQMESMMKKLNELEQFKVQAEDKLKKEQQERENRELLGLEKGQSSEHLSTISDISGKQKNKGEGIPKLRKMRRAKVLPDTESEQKSLLSEIESKEENCNQTDSLQKTKTLDSVKPKGVQFEMGDEELQPSKQPSKSKGKKKSLKVIPKQALLGDSPQKDQNKKQKSLSKRHKSKDDHVEHHHDHHECSSEKDSPIISEDNLGDDVPPSSLRLNKQNTTIVNSADQNVEKAIENVNIANPLLKKQKTLLYGIKSRVMGMGSIIDIRTNPEVEKASSDSLRSDMEEVSDPGEDFGEEEDDESIQFVDQAQMDAIKKQLEEQHRVNDTLRSLITDVSEDLNNFKEFISPGNIFSYQTYKDALDEDDGRDQQVRDKIDEEAKQIHQILVEHEQNHRRDCGLLYQEIMFTNRRVFNVKKDIKEDFESFSQVLQQMDKKQLQFLQAAINIIEVAKQVSTVVSINTLLMKQDEMDKKAIFLMGTREKEQTMTKAQVNQNQMSRLNDYYQDPQSEIGGSDSVQIKKGELDTDNLGQPPKSIITFDKRCISCSDQPQKLLTAFKMACLTYLPGNITYNFQEYSRQAMITVMDKHVGCLEGINQETTNLIRDLGFQMQFEQQQNMIGDQGDNMNEKQKVLFFDTKYSQTDIDILHILAAKKDIFNFDQQVSKSEAKLKIYAGHVPDEQPSTQFMSPMRVGSPINNAVEDETQKLKMLASKRQMSGVSRNKELIKVTSGADLNHVMGQTDYVGTQNVEITQIMDESQQQSKSQEDSSTHQSQLQPRQTEISAYNEPTNMNYQKQLNSSPLANDMIKQQTLTYQSSKNLKSFDNQKQADKFNIPHKKSLINIEIRDQSDQIYFDSKSRDINGNVKNQIGHGIDDVDTRYMYENDEAYLRKLEKLANIKRKSSLVYQTKISEKDPLMLPVITTPLLQGFDQKVQERNMEDTQSYKGFLDDQMQRNQAVLWAKVNDENAKEAMTPSGAGVKTSMGLRSRNFVHSNILQLKNQQKEYRQMHHRSMTQFTNFTQQSIKRQISVEKSADFRKASGFYEQIMLQENERKRMAMNAIHKSTGTRNSSPNRISRAESATSDYNQRCLAKKDPSYAAAKKNYKLMVDPNNVPALKQLVNRRYSTSKSTLLPSQQLSNSTSVMSRGAPSAIQSFSVKPFKFEEHFAKRSSLQFDQMGGHQQSSLLMQSDKFVVEEKSEALPVVTQDLKAVPKRQRINIDMINVKDDQFDQQILSDSRQFGMKLKEQYQHK